MFSLLSNNSDKSVEYWEGWQAVDLKKQCTYTDPKQRKEWAKGFADGVKGDINSKIWYKSRTMIVGLIMLSVGAGLTIYGIWAGGGSMVTGFGSGISSSSIIMAALRLITEKEVNFRDQPGPPH
jgi:hypothetical protein